MSAHESIRREEVRQSTDRAFGLVFTAVFALVGLVPLWSGRPPRLWALVVGLAFLGASLVRPAVLGPLNHAWGRFGRLLNRITNPIVLGVLFFGVFTPFGWATRLFGRDRMQRTFDKRASSYWIPREPPGPAPDSMSRQF
jgi:hypothetical protein